MSGYHDAYTTLFSVAQRCCILGFRLRLFRLLGLWGRLFRRRRLFCWRAGLALLLLRFRFFLWRRTYGFLLCFCLVFLGLRVGGRRLVIWGRRFGFLACLLLITTLWRSTKLQFKEVLSNCDCVFLVGKKFFDCTSFRGIDSNVDL